MTSVLKCIGKSPRSGQYSICFYYQHEAGYRDATLPMWEVPARSWYHMQDTVAAFNTKASDEPVTVAG